MGTIEDRLRRLGADLPEPGADFEERLITTAHAAQAEDIAPRRLPSVKMRHRARFGMRLLAAALALLAAGGIAFAAVVGSGSGPAGWAANGGGLPLASKETAQAVSGDPLLRDAPWFSQPEGSPSLDEVKARPSLVFGAGTTYDQAIDALYVSVITSGRLPAGTTLGPPLPKQIVFARSPERSALSLTAAFGYAIPGGNILLPSISYPRGMTMEEVGAAKHEAAQAGRVVPQGAKVSGNPDPLDRCQVMINDKVPQPCTR